MDRKVGGGRDCGAIQFRQCPQDHHLLVIVSREIIAVAVQGQLVVLGRQGEGVGGASAERTLEDTKEPINTVKDVGGLGSQAKPGADEAVGVLFDPDQIGEILPSARFAHGFHDSPPSRSCSSIRRSTVV